MKKSSLILFMLVFSCGVSLAQFSLDKFEKKDLIGKSFLLWQIGRDGTITLSNDGDKTIVVNLEAVGIPFNGVQNGR